MPPGDFVDDRSNVLATCGVGGRLLSSYCVSLQPWEARQGISFSDILQDQHRVDACAFVIRAEFGRETRVYTCVASLDADYLM